MNRNFSLFCFLSVLSLAYARLKGEGIIGGDVATSKQFPYQISIQAEGHGHICGGGIIGERFILTAAHCVFDAGKFSPFLFNVVFDTTDVNDPEQGRTIKVEKIYILISYRPRFNYANDIAVLKLKENIGLSNSGLRKLKLPRGHRTYAGRIAKISGFGYNWVEVSVDPVTGMKSETNGTTDNKLRYVDTKIISNAECRYINKYTPVFNTHICGQALPRQINGQLAGVCSGDSGSPLVVGNTIVGVVSVSPVGCEESKEAAAYTRVSSYLIFIDNVMNGIETARMRVHTVAWNHKTS